jgi:hypothetical protein
MHHPTAAWKSTLFDVNSAVFILSRRMRALAKKSAHLLIFELATVVLLPLVAAQRDPFVMPVRVKFCTNAASLLLFLPHLC